jgi:hypothetical protein
MDQVSTLFRYNWFLFNVNQALTFTNITDDDDKSFSCVQFCASCVSQQVNFKIKDLEFPHAKKRLVLKSWNNHIIFNIPLIATLIDEYMDCYRGDVFEKGILVIEKNYSFSNRSVFHEIPYIIRKGPFRLRRFNYVFNSPNKCNFSLEINVTNGNNTMREYSDSLNEIEKKWYSQNGHLDLSIDLNSPPSYVNSHWRILNRYDWFVHNAYEI